MEIMTMQNDDINDEGIKTSPSDTDLDKKGDRDVKLDNNDRDTNSVENTDTDDNDDYIFEPLDEKDLIEIEQALKDLDTDEIDVFRDELASLLGQDLLKDRKFVDLLDKYKPNVAVDKAKLVVEKLDASKVDDVPQHDYAQELLRVKIENELLKNNCPKEWLDDAVVVALSKVKDKSDLSGVKEVAGRYSKLNSDNNTTHIHTNTTTHTRTSASIGGQNTRDLTDGERAVEYLRKKNPTMFK